jgi:hypothetical protein
MKQSTNEGCQLIENWAQRSELSCIRKSSQSTEHISQLLINNIEIAVQECMTIFREDVLANRASNGVSRENGAEDFRRWMETGGIIRNDLNTLRETILSRFTDME